MEVPQVVAFQFRYRSVVVELLESRFEGREHIREDVIPRYLQVLRSPFVRLLIDRISCVKETEVHASHSAGRHFWPQFGDHRVVLFDHLILSALVAGCTIASVQARKPSATERNSS